MAYAQTLAASITGEYHEKGSKFFAYGFPCSTEKTFFVELGKLRHLHPKARHHCYAWRFGETGQEYRANDDGEPNGSAGLPIYNQLQSFDISNCGVIVVRYFGGTLLGVSGLIRAYKNATQDALNQATFIPIMPKTTFTVTLDYAQIHQLMQVVEKYRIKIIAQEMAMPCIYELEVERDCLVEVITVLEKQHIYTS